jgi:predicted SnoaL-like aldol condensation-catalyzing enzyme
MKCIRPLVLSMILSGMGMMSWSAAHADSTQEAANKRLVIDYFAALDRLETLDARDLKEQVRKAMTKYVRPDYIQHNESFARFGQGSAGLIRMLESRLDASNPSSKPTPQGTSREMAVMAKGDLVIRVNSREQLDRAKPPLIIFNLLRIQDGLIAEHWDGASGGTMPGQ